MRAAKDQENPYHSYASPETRGAGAGAGAEAHSGQRARGRAGATFLRASVVSASRRRAPSETAHVWAVLAALHGPEDTSRRGSDRGRAGGSHEELRPPEPYGRVGRRGKTVQSCSDRFLAHSAAAAESRGARQFPPPQRREQPAAEAAVRGAGGSTPVGRGAPPGAPARGGRSGALAARAGAPGPRPPQPGGEVFSGRSSRLLLRGMQTHARTLLSLRPPCLVFSRLTFTESTGYMTECSRIPAIAPAVMWVDKEALVGRFS